VARLVQCFTPMAKVFTLVTRGTKNGPKACTTKVRANVAKTFGIRIISGVNVSSTRTDKVPKRLANGRIPQETDLNGMAHWTRCDD